MSKKKNTNEYPKTVAEVLDDKIKYRDATNEIMQRFKELKPYRGSKENVQEKLLQLNHDLSQVYGIKEPQLVFVEEFYPSSCYFPIGNLIVLTEEVDGRYSVVVFLHEFAHALGKDEKGACRWSINLFRLNFPKSFAKLVPQGHLLFKKDSPALENGV